MILNIRGPSSSGKSHIVRQLLREFPSSEVWEKTGWNKTRGKQIGHLLPGGLFIVGPYSKAKNVGLADLQPGRMELTSLWIERNAVRYPHVIFESTAASLSIGRYHEMSERLAAVSGITFAFLDTPLAICKERLGDSSAAAGVQWDRVNQIRDRLTDLKETCLSINHEDAYAQTITLLQTIGGWDPFSTPPIVHPKVRTRYTLQDVWNEMQINPFNGVPINESERFKRLDTEMQKHREKFPV
jgi:hypothetical protein